MKKKMFAVFGIVIALILIYLAGSGFTKNTSAFITDYSVSDDGKEMTVNVGVSSSMGYIRNVDVRQQHGGKLYLVPYAAFGGINGRMGAKDTFAFPLDADTELVALYRGTDRYEEVLTKAQDGRWVRTAAR